MSVNTDKEDEVPRENNVERGVEEQAEEEQHVRTEPSDKIIWNDASRLLFQSGYMKVLKSMALSGQLQQYNIRSVVWRLFLHILPDDQSLWETATKATRETYTQIKKMYVMDPHEVTASLDITLNNPLSQSQNSPWNRFFQDNELRQLVSQDVVRTFPDIQFFRQDHIQQMMEDILFCYVREKPDLGYRQGMHELLAPILFVMHVEMRDVNSDTSLAPVLRVVLDPTFIEHDTYAIFSEVMEMVEPWYSTVGLEADQVKAKQQTRKNNAMTRDPRTSKPFEESDTLGPSSAISRKLDVVHNILLKKADETLYLHLKQLSIPPQTYGIRWIRLLFGREFPLPNVLEVWDALFADGPSLVDYMCVSMLMHIREVLIDGDYTTCMHHLMHFPTVYEVNYLIQRSLHLRNPNLHPSPRLWPHHPHHKLQQSPHTHPLLLNTPPLSSYQTPPTNTQQQQNQSTSRAKQAGAKAKSAISTAGKQLAAGIKRKDGGSEGKAATSSPATSPPPNIPPSVMSSNPPVAKVTSMGKRGRGKIIGELNSEPKEMKNNPKMTTPSSSSMTQVERLTGRVDDLEAKVAYCGSKMDTLLLDMENEISALTDGKQLSPETENTLLLSLAGLKHVRDILLNKICFSGAMLKDEHNVIVNREQDDPNGAHHSSMEMSSHVPNSLSVATGNGDAIVEQSPGQLVRDTPPIGKTMEIHPLMSSNDSSDRSGGEQWVNVSHGGHPLVRSSDS